MKALYFFAFLLIHWFLFAQIIYVTPGGSGTKDGSSWGNALGGNDTTASGYTRLADTLRYALSGSQFWVAEGTYKPCVDGGLNKFFDCIFMLRTISPHCKISMRQNSGLWK